MQVNHYLIANRPLKSSIRWNGNILPMELKRALENVASWRKLNNGERDLFRGFTPSGRRSYLCVLAEPIASPAGAHSAIKLKALGNTDPSAPHPPRTERFEIDPNIINVRKDGNISVQANNMQPFCGSTHARAVSENAFMGLANESELPSPIALGVGEYPGLEFKGETLGFSIMAVENAETEKMRLANIFQVSLPRGLSPEVYLLEVANSFFLQNSKISDLEYFFYAAGEIQRQYNNKGLILRDSHTGNFAITKDAGIEPRDFDLGLIKNELSVPQIAIHQLLALNRFIYTTFLLRARPAGEHFLKSTHPISSYLEGYFGAEIFSRHTSVIGTPEKLVRGLERPLTQVRENSAGADFIASVEIMKYSWVFLYEPLQEILAAEGNGFPLGQKERIDRCLSVYRDFLRNHEQIASGRASHES